MNIEIFLESVLNPNGRFRTLEGVFAVRGDDGEPLMTITGTSIGFEVSHGGERWVLRCFPKADAGREQRLRELSVYTQHIDCQYITPHVYLEKEMLVFDAGDRAVWVDVVMQRVPAGERLDRIVPSAEVRAWLAELAGWLAENDFGHGNVCAKNIFVTPHGPVLVNYTHSSRKRSADDLHAVGVLTAALYAAELRPEMRDIIRAKMLTANGLRELPHILADIVELGGALCDTLPADEICAAIGRVASMPSPAVPKSANAGEQPPKYDFIGEMGDMLMRVDDGREWFYIDTAGRRAFPAGFVHASDFSEGRAVVETADGYGLIDREGRFVIDPNCCDIEWDHINNVAIVTVDGLSGLFDRNGAPLTGIIYDLIMSGNDGLFAVRKDGLYGYVDRDGKVEIALQFADAFGFKDGHARIRCQGQSHDALIDRDGEVVEEIII